jgi:hypothetical protein
VIPGFCAVEIPNEHLATRFVVASQQARVVAALPTRVQDHRFNTLVVEKEWSSGSPLLSSQPRGLLVPASDRGCR